MALELPNSIYFHVGRTAGHWVRFTVQQIGLKGEEVGAFHDWPSRIEMTEARKDKLAFCFIRHPLAWLRSFWSHQMYFGWDVNGYSAPLVSDNFSDFLKKALVAYPSGPVSEIYRPFIDGCQFVGRQESIYDDLLVALTVAGEKFNPADVHDNQVVTEKVPSDILECAVAPESLLREVMRCESTLCAKWNYTEIPTSMIGAPNTCLVPYVPLSGEFVSVDAVDSLRETRFENAFRIGERTFAGMVDTRRATKLLYQVLQKLSFGGKSLLDVNCGDGVFSLYGKSLGASRVVAVAPFLNESPPLLTTCSNCVDFVNAGVYELPEKLGEKFDLVFCFRMLEGLRYPFFAFRNLSKLLTNGGVLVLECAVLDAYNDMPILLCPTGSESPVNARYCTYFNKKGLIDNLSIFGFHEFEMHSEFRHGLDPSRPFAKWDFSQEVLPHASESAIGRMIMTCRWSSEHANIKLPDEEATLGDLVLEWDQHFSSTAGSPTSDAADLARSLKRLNRIQHEQIALLAQEAAIARSALADREVDLQTARDERDAVGKDLVDRTEELVQTRAVLIERTLSLESLARSMKGET